MGHPGIVCSGECVVGRKMGGVFYFFIQRACRWDVKVRQPFAAIDAGFCYHRRSFLAGGAGLHYGGAGQVAQGDGRGGTRVCDRRQGGGAVRDRPEARQRHELDGQGPSVCRRGERGGREKWMGMGALFPACHPRSKHKHTHTHTHTGLADNTRCRSGWRRSTPTRR